MTQCPPVRPQVGLSPSLDDSITWNPCPQAYYSDYGTWQGCGGQPQVYVADYVPPTEWAAWWVRALADAPHFSWLFVQDHRGGGESPQHIRAYFAALGKAMATINVTNWANAELFHIMPCDMPGYGEGNLSRTCGPIDRVQRQLLEEAPYVAGFTSWEFHWYLSPAGGVQMHRASRDNRLHSNGSLTLYRNYQRTILAPGVALILVTAGHSYHLFTAPSPQTWHGISAAAGAAGAETNATAAVAAVAAVAASSGYSGGGGGGMLTDGHAYSQLQCCLHWDASAPSPIRIALNLTSTAEARLKAPFRLTSAFRAYFMRLDRVDAAMPGGVTVTCSLKGRLGRTKVVTLKPVTKFPSNNKMVIYDVTLDDPLEVTTCEFAIEHTHAVLLAELEAYE